MESCYSANYWGRVFESMDYRVNLIPPHQVKPFVVGSKNDHNDALAIGEASFRDTTVFVPVKTLQQQDMQSLHRIRDRYIKSRTAIANQMRGLLPEYGIIIARRLAAFPGEINREQILPLHPSLSVPLLAQLAHPSPPHQGVVLPLKCPVTNNYPHGRHTQTFDHLKFALKC